MINLKATHLKYIRNGDNLKVFLKFDTTKFNIKIKNNIKNGNVIYYSKFSGIRRIAPNKDSEKSFILVSSPSLFGNYPTQISIHPRNHNNQHGQYP